MMTSSTTPVCMAITGFQLTHVGMADSNRIIPIGKDHRLRLCLSSFENSLLT